MSFVLRLYKIEKGSDRIGHINWNSAKGKGFRAFFPDRPALLPTGSAGIGWRFAESHILGLPAADAQKKAVQRNLPLLP